jgi:hypothetical protein
MKHSTKSMATAAAVLMVTAGVASAQSVLRAEVPFAFHVGSKVMEPGTIQMRLVHGITGATVLFVGNNDAGRSYMLLPKSEDLAPRRWIESGQAKLAFDCTSGACILVRVWTGAGPAYEFYGPKTRSGEVLLTEIVMKSDKGD